jgi:hypothetical protein
MTTPRPRRLFAVSMITSARQVVYVDALDAWQARELAEEAARVEYGKKCELASEIAQVSGPWLQACYWYNVAGSSDVLRAHRSSGHRFNRAEAALLEARLWALDLVVTDRWNEETEAPSFRCSGRRSQDTRFATADEAILMLPPPAVVAIPCDDPAAFRLWVLTEDAYAARDLGCDDALVDRIEAAVDRAFVLCDDAARGRVERAFVASQRRQTT